MAILAGTDFAILAGTDGAVHRVNLVSVRGRTTSDDIPPGTTEEFFTFGGFTSVTGVAAIPARPN